MKRNGPRRRAATMVILILVTVLLLSGCGERAGELLAERYQSSLEVEEPTPAPNAVNGLRAYSVAEEREDTTIFSRNPSGLRIGEVVTFTGTIESGWTEGRAVELAETIREDESTAWVSPAYLVPGGELAVVLSEDAPLFDGPTVGSPSPFTMPRGTIVVISPRFVHNGFVSITGWDEQNDRGYPEIFIRPRHLSAEPDDVAVAMMLFRAARESDAETRAQLLEQAQGFGETAFDVELQGALE